jgi:hypothetical protein
MKMIVHQECSGLFYFILSQNYSVVNEKSGHFTGCEQ